METHKNIDKMMKLFAVKGPSKPFEPDYFGPDSLLNIHACELI